MFPVKRTGAPRPAALHLCRMGRHCRIPSATWKLVLSFALTGFLNPMAINAGPPDARPRTVRTVEVFEPLLDLNTYTTESRPMTSERGQVNPAERDSGAGLSSAMRTASPPSVRTIEDLEIFIKELESKIASALLKPEVFSQTDIDKMNGALATRQAELALQKAKGD